MKKAIAVFAVVLSAAISFAAGEKLQMFESDAGALDAFWQDGLEVRGTAFAENDVYVAYPHGLLRLNRFGWFVRQIPVKQEIGDIFWFNKSLYVATADWTQILLFDERMKRTGEKKFGGKAAFQKAKRRACRVPEGLEVPAGYEYLPVAKQGYLPRFGKTSFVDKVCRIEYFEMSGGKLVDITKCRNYKKSVNSMRGDCQPRSSEDRRKLIDPVDEGDLRLRPTFTSCSVAFGYNEYPGVRFQYCRHGTDKWQDFRTPPNYKETREYRGSLVNLEEDTEYDVRVVLRDRVTRHNLTIGEGTFRTWKTDVPIARTVEIDPATVKFPIVVKDKGTPDGWIRYTTKGGAPLVGSGFGHTFVVTDAAYVVFDDMDISGCNGGHVFDLSYSHAIRLRNLNIHDWSEYGTAVYTEKFLGRIVRDKDKPRWGIAEYAVRIGYGMTETVVERCYMHDPKNHSCSWYYSHPCGPMAILMGMPDHSTVIRYNDFVGSDLHSWDDAIGGEQNFYETGGFNRDADVYGNFFIFSCDDCIELDGGQQNIRVFGNRFESALVGVSVQGNTVSPSYVYRNLFTGMGERMGLSGETIKTSGAALTPFENRTFIWNNTLWGGGSGFSVQPQLIADIRNNVLVGEAQNFNGLWEGADDGGRVKDTRFYSNTVERADIEWPGILRAKTEMKDLSKTDLTPVSPIAGKPIENFIGPAPVQGAVQKGETAGMWPLRPIGFTLDTLRVDLGKRREFQVKCRLQPPATNHQQPSTFTIAQNADFDWFSVEPKSGTLTDGLTFTVKLDDAKMKNQHFYRGAFLVRTPNGLSRPVSIYAETDWESPIECAKEGEFALYARKDELQQSGGWYTKTFDVPKAGTYWFFIHGKKEKGAPRPVWRVKVDGGAEECSEQQATDYYSWTMLAPGRRFGLWIHQYDFEAGPHTISIKPAKHDFKEWDAIAISDSPGSFDKR